MYVQSPICALMPVQSLALMTSWIDTIWH